MKFSVKVAIFIITSYLAVLNVFGVLMIYSVHKEEIATAIYNANDKVMTMLVLFNDKENALTSRKAISDLLLSADGGTTATYRGSEIIDEGGNIIATTLKRKINIPDDIIPDYGMINNAVQKYGSNSHEALSISGIEINGSKYYLIYSANINTIYKAQENYIGLLLLFDCGGIIIITVLLMQINGKIKELQEKNEEQERFIASLTHEIRTPLTSIIGFSSLLINAANDEKMKTGLEEIHSSGIRIEGLTESLIKLLTIGKDEVEEENIALRQFIEKIVNQYQIRIDEENVNVHITGEGNFNTDSGLFSILITNIFDNALKAVKESEIKNIEITCSDGAVTISDTGCGMTKDDLKKIYEPFYMADKSRKHTYGGFGLGLAICDKIKRLLQLSVIYESEPGKGTRVTISG